MDGWSRDIYPDFQQPIRFQLSVTQDSIVLYSPSIMCVQYIWGYHEYIGGCSVHREDSTNTSLGYHKYIRGISCVHRGDIMMHMGGYHEYIGGYHEYTGGDIMSASGY